ncbi:MAG: NAD-dependent DNA ligase LigA [Bacteroidetes bacterium]|nr:MAG: NAD-dependent DNA ligase LigA [Bacteroidota bacterium]
MALQIDDGELLTTTRGWIDADRPVNSLEDALALQQLLRQHEHKYYVLNQPIISDWEYDMLYKKLEKAEALNPQFVRANSPTQRVGSSLNQGFETVSHIVPMLSLDNSYSAADLTDWDRKVRDMSKLAEVEYCIEPKFDGASLSLLYDTDLLVRSATRGDGVQGDDITANSKQIRNIPLSANFSQFGLQQVEIRGEVMMTKAAFADYNSSLAREGTGPLANPRNAAAGSLRLKDPREVGRRKLEAFLYHVSWFSKLENPALATRPTPTTHAQMLQMMWDLGFKSPMHEMKVVQGIQGVIDYCNAYEAIRDELPYEIDGMVVKVNNLDLQERLGMTTHHPRWAMAYKFKARQATTKLIGVDFQVGRTGAVTPVAKLEPVYLGGVTVSSISMHNADYISEKDLRLGDTVLVERAGDVIPQIVKSLPQFRQGHEQIIVYPKCCPACQSTLFKEADEAVWRCINIECPAQVVEKMIHFVSKDALDIKSFGEQQVRKFYQDDLLKDIPGIYTLDFERIGTLDGFGSKSIDNLKQAIAASKQQPLHRLIYGLGIRHVGESMAKALAQQVNHLLDIEQFNTEQLLEIPDVGPKVAASIVQFFKNPQNIEMLRQLEDLGLNMVQQKQAATAMGEARFSGLSFLFTGTLSRLKRSEAEAQVEKLGGSILGGVSSKLHYLVVGADAGSKLEKAKKIPAITILSEDDFVSLMQQE